MIACRQFVTLLVVTFLISVAVSLVVVHVFAASIDGILRRIVSDDISQAWVRYLRFAVYVVGISSGVRIWDLEKYVTAPQVKDAVIVELTLERWVLEIYRTIVGSLQGIAWLLLVFFVFALLAFVAVRIFETRGPKGDDRAPRTDDVAAAA